MRKSNYYRVLDHGFVGYIDHLGSDELIEQFARVSYGKGTRKKTDTAGLINYLVRNKHTSPLESCEIIFHLAMPICCARQLVRHRTCNMNESSARYSEVPDVWYTPAYERMTSQSSTNKQGSSNEPIFTQEEYAEWVKKHNEANQRAFENYQELLAKGCARETARNDLPLSCYTTMFWKMDLHNFLHFLNLRADEHAQWEIRQYAYIMGTIAKRLFPITMDAWEKHVYNSISLNSDEQGVFYGGELLASVKAKLNKKKYDFDTPIIPVNPEELLLCTK